jgi:uncharacterized protein (TIGR04255 family)
MKRRIASRDPETIQDRGLMSDKRGPYKRAPITEAVIDLRVLPTDIPPASLAALQSSLPDEYGRPVEVSYDTFALRSGGGALMTQASSAHVGYRFDRADGKRVLQASVEGFTFSAMAPYDGWESFSTEAEELWASYRQVTRAKTVTRIAVRYINRIDLPIPADEQVEPLKIETFLSTYPQISDRLRYNAFSGMVMQVEIPQPDIESVLRINQALVDPPSPEVVSILLDLDLFRGGEWNAEDDASIWEFLAILRHRKNDVFEASITDDARRLFE